MITRGYLVGQIIDDLSDIANQVKTRCDLGLTDLNVHLENFFKDILNVILETKLINLNEDRSNEPGLDLGDKNKRIAFQITSHRTSEKIEKTLGRLSDEQIKLYEKIIILIIGKKQTSYSINEKLMEKTSFTLENIWDIDDVCRKAMSISIDRLQDLHRIVSADAARVRIELEIQNVDGTFATNIMKYAEAAATPKIGKMLTFYNNHFVDYQPLEWFNDAFLAFVNKLASLPRITREFYAFMIVNRSRERIGGISGLFINADILKRVMRYPDSDGEIRILQSLGFVHMNEPNERNSGYYYTIQFPHIGEDVGATIISYYEEKKMSIFDVIQGLDFTELCDANQ
jgi:hypothetical protein